jgi:hypothetical protein
VGAAASPGDPREQDAQRVRSTSTKARVYKVGTKARLPLQLPLIRAALKATRSA